MNDHGRQHGTQPPLGGLERSGDAPAEGGPEGPPSELSSEKHEVSDDLVAVVLRCLSKTLNDRFQSASELRQALRRVAAI